MKVQYAATQMDKIVGTSGLIKKNKNPMVTERTRIL